MEFPPNFDPNALGPNAEPNDPGRGPTVISVLWVLTVIALAMVCVRYYVRSKINALGWDDYLIALAMAFQLIDVAFITKAYTYGLGKHDKDLTFNQIINAVKWGWLYLIPGACVAVLGRVSSAVFLSRLFGVKIWFRWYLIIFTGMQVIAGIAVVLVEFAGTYPVQALWDPMIQPERVTGKSALAVAYLAQTLFTVADLTYPLFAIIIIWDLKMSLGRRLGLMLIMCTSLVTMVVSIMKILTLQTNAASLKEPEYASSLAALWAGVEQTLVIIMASVPVLPAVTQVRSSIFSRIKSQLSSGFGLLSTRAQSGHRTGSDGSHEYYNMESGSKQRFATSSSLVHE